MAANIRNNCSLVRFFPVFPVFRPFSFAALFKKGNGDSLVNNKRFAYAAGKNKIGHLSSCLKNG